MRTVFQSKCRPIGRVAALLIMCAVAAGPAAATDAQQQRIRDAVQRATGLAPDSVQPSKVLPGYFEVRAKSSVAYVDAAGKVLIKGPVIDLATGENLSLGGAVGAAAKIDVAALPLGDAISTARGNGERPLVVFVDPNCSFCRALEPELDRLTNVTVHRFVVPVLGPGSQAAARQAWCASDRAAAWRQVVAGKLAPASVPARCDAAALDRNLALAKRLGVTATPTLVFAGGQRVAAVLRADEIEARLAGRAIALNP